MYKKSEKKSIYSKNIHIKDHLSEKYSEFTDLLEKGDHIGFMANIEEIQDPDRKKEIVTFFKEKYNGKFEDPNAPQGQKTLKSSFKDQ